jgi:hypothetical protein
MEQAAYDVVLNKDVWRVKSPARRAVWSLKAEQAIRQARCSCVRAPNRARPFRVLAEKANGTCPAERLGQTQTEPPSIGNGPSRHWWTPVATG